jgi:hypothetical protein
MGNVIKLLILELRHILLYFHLFIDSLLKISLLPAEKNPQVFLRLFLRILPFREISCGFLGFRKFRSYFQGFSCGFFHSKQFPANFSVLANSTGIPKDLPAVLVA